MISRTGWKYQLKRYKYNNLIYFSAQKTITKSWLKLEDRLFLFRASFFVGLKIQFRWCKGIYRLPRIYRLQHFILFIRNAIGREKHRRCGYVLMEINSLCIWKGVPWLVWLWQNSIAHSEGNCWIIKFELLHRSQMERNKIITLSPREGRDYKWKENAHYITVRVSVVLFFFQFLYSSLLWKVSRNRLILDLLCLDVF